MSNHDDAAKVLTSSAKVCRNKIKNAATGLSAAFAKLMAEKDKEICDLKEKICHLETTQQGEIRCTLEKSEQREEELSCIKDSWDSKYMKMKAKKDLEISELRKAMDNLITKHQQEMRGQQVKLGQIEKLEENVRSVHSRCEFQKDMITKLWHRNQGLENELNKLKNISATGNPKPVVP